MRSWSLSVSHSLSLFSLSLSSLPPNRFNHLVLVSLTHRRLSSFSSIWRSLPTFCVAIATRASLQLHFLQCLFSSSLLLLLFFSSHSSNFLIRASSRPLRSHASFREPPSSAPIPSSALVPSTFLPAGILPVSTYILSESTLI
ncbi:uncharacterized protein BO97DRAFT_2953 [Aspergillus homomorphus CBS 101889]|uniref:REJ domain-containing protein n=1 Tax=Aspergillus homomorphus (strain CBS 101889) TaxID=1450537 RepID=A0A395IB53_ASPHC|nr:hypothetical protein BO97DRAFT_2953 [Aspergillus homomorphus CBS 101889]RAL17251.1 hypothetical protein BO97DRAFT_2953 [Aspergillus homomorphus CBS 101889]